VTFPIAEVTGPVTLYAKWTGTVFNVTWNADGGAPAPTQHHVAYGGEIHEPAEMSKTGYTFGGWYRNENLTPPATFPIAGVTSNIALYAKWTLNPTPIAKSFAASNIRAYTTGNSIVLENLPQNAKVEIYNLQGKRIYLGNPENLGILQIPVQTKGIYLVNVNGKTFKIAK
jgi:uncharacterized repeat protein (TIGR02543 family)